MKIIIQPFNWQGKDNEDEIYSIRCWGLNKDSESVLVRFETFTPFIQISLPKEIVWEDSKVSVFIDWLKYVLKNDAPISYKHRKCYESYYYSENKYDFLQINFKNLNSMYHCIKLLNRPRSINFLGSNLSFQVCEENIDQIKKFLNLRKCNFSQWFEVEVEEVDFDFQISKFGREFDMDEKKIAGCDCLQGKEYIGNWKTLELIDPKITDTWQTYPGILAFDIETYSKKHKALPCFLNSSDVVYMISCIYYKKGQIKRYGIIKGITDELPGFAHIFRVETEQELIQVFADIVNALDPIIITGYNIFGYDYEYCDNRLSRRGHDWPEMGRLLDEKTEIRSSAWKSSGYGYTENKILYMAGRISIDMMIIIKRDNKFSKYSLDFVSNYFLNEKKHEVKASEMFTYYEDNQIAIKNNDSNDMILAKEKMSLVMKYCIQDSELVIKLFNKLNIWISLIEMSNVVSVSITDIFTRGQQIRCMNQIYDLTYMNNYVITKRVKEELPFSGGYVMDPIPGKYDNIICLDFSSLYPSIMRTYNICHTCLVTDDNIEDDKCHVMEFDQEEVIDEDDDEGEEETLGEVLEKQGKKKKTKKEKEENKKITHYKYRFIKEEIRKGILPQLLENLVNQRKMVRRHIDGYTDPITGEITPKEKDPIVISILNSRQLALKVSANSIYGFLGSQRIGKLPLIEGAQSVTAIGRSLIGKVNTFLKEKYNARIVYGDTDSTMVDLDIKDRKEANKWGMRLSQEISGIRKGQKIWDGTIAGEDKKGLFPGCLAMEFEKAMKMICLTKKKYAAFLIDNKGEFKKKRNSDENEILNRGIVLSRRDNSPFVRKFYEKLMIKILNDVNIKEILSDIIDNISNLVKGKIDWHDLLIVRTMGIYNAESCYFMKSFSEYLKSSARPVTAGERLEYLIIDGPGKTGENMRMAEQYDEVVGTSEQMKINYTYYVKQAMNPIDQLFSVAFSNIFNRLKEINDDQLPTIIPPRGNAIDICYPIKTILSYLKYSTIDKLEVYKR